MKKCPSCEKTYEDSMRFCQIDGTPLVDDAPPLDPYKTIVARPISTSEPTPEPPTPAALEPQPVAPAAFEPPAPVAVEPEPPAAIAVEPEPAAAEETAPAPEAIHEPEEVLDLPAADPLKTMYVSEDEMRKALGAVGVPAEPEPEMEIPSPEPPKFIQHEMPSTSDPTPMLPEFEKTKPPIPSPFGDQPQEAKITAPKTAPDEEPETVMQNFPPASPFSTPPAEPTPEPEPEPAPQFTPPPAVPAFAEPEPFQPAVASPFQDQSSPVPQDNSPAAWTPPPAPDANWQNQEIGSNTPFQPPPAGGSVNQTLAIVSLVLGILSICCYISPVTGLAALITGFMARKNIKNDPANYGGNGLALAGMIVGGIFFLIGVAYWVFIILVYAGIFASSMIPQLR